MINQTVQCFLVILWLLFLALLTPDDRAERGTCAIRQGSGWRGWWIIPALVVISSPPQHYIVGSPPNAATVFPPLTSFQSETCL